MLTAILIRSGKEEAEISQRANAMFDYLLPVMDFVSVATARDIAAESPLRDPNDRYIWATAVMGEAQYVISHNTTDFPPLVQTTETIDGEIVAANRHLFQGIEFLTAIEFVENVLGQDAVGILGAPLPEEGMYRSGRAVRSSL